MSNLKAYLAEKYMSGPKADAILAKAAPQKKKKRKAHVSTVSTSVDSGALIQDEDGGWPGEPMDEGDDDITEAVIASDRGFKKRKVAPLEDASGWATIQEGWTVKPEDKDATPPPEEGEDKPQVVNENEFVGGLVTAKQLKKVLPQSRVADTATLTQEEIAKAQETVYRDSTGRKIDTKAAKAEAARLKREKEEREAKKMEWGKGLVQKEEAEARRSEMEKMKNRKFARGRDDEELNEEQKGKEVWNDPAAAFMTVGQLCVAFSGWVG